MPRYEFVEGTSRKFWEIDLQGSSFTTRWGRLGTEGQSKRQDFADPDTARHEYELLVRSKEKKGYQLVGAPPPAPAGETVECTVVRLEDARGNWRELELRGLKLTQRVAPREDDSGETSTRYDSLAEAKEQLEHLTARYVKNGLREVSRKTELRSVHDEPAAVEGRLTQHPEYERACLESPEDVAPWRIYADWLQEQGDVRGELAALFLGKQAPKGWAFFKQHRDALLGEHSEQELYDVEFDNGFVAALSMKRPYDGGTELAELTRDVLGRPGARFVTRLRFGLASYESDNDWTDTLDAILASPVAAWLRRLEFNDYTYEDCEISWTPYGSVAALWKGLPRLEHLHVRSGQGGELGRIEHAQLKTFIRESGGLASAELEAIVAAKWPQLEHLEVWTGSGNYGAEATTDQLGPLLRGEGLPRLKTLGIVNSELSTELLGELAASPLLPRLAVLDLSKGVFTDAEVDGWIRLAPKFRHLQRLDLSGNLFEERLEELKAALPNAVLADQRENYGDDEDRYVAVGE
ncbi:MAG: WGR domain-containing protein [Myxococcota bacterium]